MDLFDVARSCFRRWYVFLPLLLIMAWFSHSVVQLGEARLLLEAVIGLAPPSIRVDTRRPRGPVTAKRAPRHRRGTTDRQHGCSRAATNRRSWIGWSRPAACPTTSPGCSPSPATMPPLPLIMIEATDADPAAVD